MAKDCRVTLKCLECNSEKHVSALHPGPPPTTRGSQEVDKDDGGEVNGNALTPVTSKCTEICGNSDGQHSCSKISPVIVYPAGRREEAKKMYAVLDEQSNKSLAKSEFFHLFNITTTSDPYTLKTCSGVTKAMGRRATNLMIEIHGSQNTTTTTKFN